MDSHTASDVSAIILSSGLSERMGQHKALLRWDRSRSFLEKIAIEFLDAGCSRIFCTVNSSLLPMCESLITDPRIRFILNEHPEWGRMHSLCLGLKELGREAYCFIHNVDNPFITKIIILKILAAKEPDAWCSPEFSGKGGHPVLLPKSIIREIVKENAKNGTLQETLKRFPKRIVSVDDASILKNINSPEDYRDLVNHNC